MRRGVLDVAQRDPGVERSSDEGMPECAGRDGLADAGAEGDLPDDPPGVVSAQPPAISRQEQRSFGSLAGCEVDRQLARFCAPLPGFGGHVRRAAADPVTGCAGQHAHVTGPAVALDDGQALVLD